MNEEIQELLVRYKDLEENFNHKCMHLTQCFQDLILRHGARHDAISVSDYLYEALERMIKNGKQYNGECE